VNRSLCTCPIPHRSYRTENRPRGDQFCTCGGYIEPSWTSNDQTMGELYDRLVPFNRQPHPYLTDQEGKPLLVVPETFDQFRIDGLARERAGRDKFGLRFLGRDGCRDGMEEQSDSANYAAFEIIKRVNRYGDDTGVELLLRAMQGSYEVYADFAAARAALKGAP
jgi:hypothetical protein